jgi:hypothetical protein
VIKFWRNGDKKIHNTCLQKSGCHAKLSRCGDLYPGFVEPCHNFLRLVYHSVIWGTGSRTLALDRGDRSTSHHLLCNPPSPPHTHQNQILDRPGHSLITMLTELSQLPHYQGTKWKYLIHSHQKHFLKLSHFENALKVYEMLQWWCQITNTLLELRSCGEAMLLNHNIQNYDCLLIAQKVTTVSCRSCVKLGTLVPWSLYVNTEHTCEVRVEPKCLEKRLCQCTCVHHTSYMDNSEAEPDTAEGSCDLRWSHKSPQSLCCHVHCESCICLSYSLTCLIIIGIFIVW